MKSTYLCACATGFTGINCDTKITNPCLLNPCLNNGLCQVTSPNIFNCICQPGYSGFYCQYSNDICQKQICLLNYTGQSLSIYSELDTGSFDSYRSCIINTWVSLNTFCKSSLYINKLKFIILHNIKINLNLF